MQNNVVVAADITLTLTVSQKGKKKRKKELKDKHSYNKKPSSGHLFFIKDISRLILLFCISISTLKLWNKEPKRSHAS